MENVNVEIVTAQEVSVTEAQSRAEIDIQVSTAKKYPRDVPRAISKAIAIVAKSKEIAETCHYSLPRGGKSITGPSVHLARILAAEYKNLRVDSRIVDIGDKMLTAQSICIDLENNYAVRTEVKRRITDRYNQRYSEDMIVTTANAALSIASRNAILQVIPRSVTDEVYKTVQQVLVGNLGDEEKLIKRREESLAFFKSNYAVEETEIFELLGVKTANGIKEQQILELVGLAQALKDGDTTIDMAFGRGKKSAKPAETAEQVQKAMQFAEEAKSKLKNKQNEDNGQK